MDRATWTSPRIGVNDAGLPSLEAPPGRADHCKMEYMHVRMK
jgi:hypothetical protein